VRRERRGIGSDADGEVLLAGDRHLADARRRLDLLRQDRVGEIVDLVDRQLVGPHRIDQHRPVGGVDLAVSRRVGQVPGQQAAGGVDRRLDVGGGAVGAAAQRKLQDDRGIAEPAPRRHGDQAGDGGELHLERRGDRGRHGLRAGARQAGADRDGREIGIGQGGDGQQRVGRAAQHQQAHHQQRGGDGPADVPLGEAHGVGSVFTTACGLLAVAAEAVADGSICTRAPSVSRY
jgi:hypothetical protein